MSAVSDAIERVLATYQPLDENGLGTLAEGIEDCLPDEGFTIVPTADLAAKAQGAADERARLGQPAEQQREEFAAQIESTLRSRAWNVDRPRLTAYVDAIWQAGAASQRAAFGGLLADEAHEVVGSGGQWYCTDCNAYTEAEGRCPWNDALTRARDLIAERGAA